jgi:hypothetical protein
MKTRMKAAFWSYLIALLLLAIFGLIYLFRPQFMPYHADAVGMSWDEVPHAFQILIIALMKSLGGALLAIVVTLGGILFVPFRKNELWAKYLLPVGAFVYTISALYVTLSVRATTPAEPPWIAVVAGMVLTLVGFLLSLSKE